MRLPLSGRVTSDLLRNADPYAAWLEVAAALEGDSNRAIREVCDTHGVDTEEVNRALLHALAAG